MKQFFSENKKLVFIFSGVIGLFILIFIIIAIVKGIKGTTISPEKLEKLTYEKGVQYFEDNEDKLPLSEGGEVTVTLETLASEGYIKPLDKLTNVSCTGGLTVKKNGEYYFYAEYIECGSTYKTKRLVDVLTDASNIVTEGDGLYKVGDEYWYRGEYPNNYVSFNDSLWRILNIDKDGNMRMVNTAPTRKIVWDNRYNENTKKFDGINDYKVSRLKEYLNEEYEKLGEKSRHIVAQKACVGKRSETEYRIDRSIDCSEILEDQKITTINIYDLYFPSLDNSCETTKSRNCYNYNYVNKFIIETWTMNASSDNDQKVFKNIQLVPFFDKASDKQKVHSVISISKHEKYISGNGKEKSPYLFVNNGK